MKVTATQLQRGPCLKLIFSFGAIGDDIIVESEQFNLNNLAEVRFKFNFQAKTSGNIIHSVSWKKHESVPTSSIFNNTTVQIHVKCEQLQQQQIILVAKDHWSEWKNMGELTKSITQQTLYMNASKVTLIVSKVENHTFPNLYHETEFCDFHLKTDVSNASVPVHKACISLHSDVFKRMLLHGEWKENKNGFVEIEGVTLQTLVNLKKYIYLGILPNDDEQLRPLLQLAKCYMINNLMAECVRRMAITVKPEDLYSMQEFAIDNKILELIQAIVQITSDETVHIAHQMENDKVDPITKIEKN